MILGNRGGTHVGESFLRAAQDLGLEAKLADAREAMAAPLLLRIFNWRVRGRRPTRLKGFSRNLKAQVVSFRPQWLLCTGIAPCRYQELQAINAMGVHTVNYLTDEPFGAAHRAPWFLEALRHYEHVFSPRRANIRDLVDWGCGRVRYMPFAYDPALHYREPSRTPEETWDAVFVGGADRDRLPYVTAVLDADIPIALYGQYWDRFPCTRAHARGYADPATLRKVTSLAKVAICLVRRANRDGHVMRSFEIPAVGTCMLAEDTDEHREIFGEDGNAVLYFRGAKNLVTRLRWLLDNQEERLRLAQAAHRLVTQGPHTYRDRLLTILS